MIRLVSGTLICALDGDSSEVGQPGDEVSVNGGPCSGVVFADRDGAPRHEEFVARQGECEGEFAHDEAAVNGGSRAGVVFADKSIGVRHEEHIA